MASTSNILNEKNILKYSKSFQENKPFIRLEKISFWLPPSVAAQNKILVFGYRCKIILSNANYHYFISIFISIIIFLKNLVNQTEPVYTRSSGFICSKIHKYNFSIIVLWSNLLTECCRIYIYILKRKK